MYDDRRRPFNRLGGRSKLSSRAGIYCHMSTIRLGSGEILTSLYKGSAGSGLLSDVDDESRVYLWKRRESYASSSEGACHFPFWPKPREFAELFSAISVTAGVDEAETGPLRGRASRGTHTWETGDCTGGVQ